MTKRRAQTIGCPLVRCFIHGSMLTTTKYGAKPRMIGCRPMEGLLVRLIVWDVNWKILPKHWGPPLDPLIGRRWSHVRM